MSEACGRCGVDVPPIMSGPSGGRDKWWRYSARVKRTHTSNVFQFSIWKREWLPVNARDALDQTYTELPLCDDCAGKVFMFAQGKEVD